MTITDKKKAERKLLKLIDRMLKAGIPSSEIITALSAAKLELGREFSKPRTLEELAGEPLSFWTKEKQ